MTPSAIGAADPNIPPSVKKLDCHSPYDCFGILWRFTYHRGGVKMKEITDGTSHTFLIGESSPVDGNSPACVSEGTGRLRESASTLIGKNYAALCSRGKCVCGICGVFAVIIRAECSSHLQTARSGLFPTILITWFTEHYLRELRGN